jgi:hypothetical protein
MKGFGVVKVGGVIALLTLHDQIMDASSGAGA